METENSESSMTAENITGKTRFAAGHEKPIHRIAWSADGIFLHSSSQDLTLRTWQLRFLKEATNPVEYDFVLTEDQIRYVPRSPSVKHVAWSPYADRVVTTATPQSETSARVISLDRDHRFIWEQQMHYEAITSLSWSLDGKLLATGSSDQYASVWYEDGTPHRQLPVDAEVSCVAFSPDGKLLATGSQNSTENFIMVWDIASEKIAAVLRGHNSGITCLTWWRGKDGSRLLASGSVDSSIHVWDVRTGRSLCQLNMHTAPITSLSVSHDGTMLASAAQDETVCFWSRPRSYDLVHLLNYTGMNYAPCDIAFHPHRPLLAAVSDTRNIAVTAFNLPALHARTHEIQTVYYSIAKVAVVGDGGVGKSSLCRALHNRQFEDDLFATHGMNIVPMVAPTEPDRRGGKPVRREVYLYDLAGQGDYQLVHRLYLSNITAALMVFAMNSSEPFRGLRRWNQILQQIQEREQPTGEGAAAVVPPQPMKKFLVQTRVDQLGATMPSSDIEQIKERIGCDAFFATSAKDNIGIEDLRLALLRGIEWERVTQSITTVVFDKIRLFLENLKIADDKIHPSGVKIQIAPVNRLYKMFVDSKMLEEAHLIPDLRRQFDTSLKFLEARQIIRRFDFGSLVLLQPELLNSYASSIIAAARRGERSRFGSIKESEILQPGDLGIPEDQRIQDPQEEEWMLIATMRDLLRYEVALRVENESELIFPSHFITGQHGDFEHAGREELIFTFKGAVINVYAVLIVRLARSNIFELTKLARHKAQFLSPEVSLCGISLDEDADEGTLRIYFAGDIGQLTRYTFDMFIYNQLTKLALKGSVVRQPVYYCANLDCPSPDPIRFPPDHIETRRRMGKHNIICPICGELTSIVPPPIPPQVDAELKRRLALMNRQADLAREQQTAESIYSAKVATNNFDVHIEWHPTERDEIAHLIELLKGQGIYALVKEQPLKPSVVSEQAKSVVFFIGRHELSDKEVAAIHQRVKYYLAMQLPVIFALHQVAHMPDALLRDFNRQVESVYFFDELKDRDTLAQLVSYITGRDPR